MSPAPTRRRLLLADDSVTIQRVIELTFADENIEVVAVSDGDAALARLDADPPDIVLADVGMPGRDGYDVALHVHRTPALAHIPVVLLIGALQPLDDQRAKAAGCAGVLVKPFEPNLVIAKVKELLERGAGPAPAAEPAPGPPEAAPQPPTPPDDYFARLDAAFASFESEGAGPARPDPAGASPPDAGAGDAPAVSAPPGTERPVAGPGAAAEPHVPEPAAAAPPDPAGASPAAPWQAAGSGGATMADAFAALLAVEQGQSPSRLPDDWPSPLAGIVEEIAARVVEQATERVVRAMAPEIVARVAERVVREEIERLRQELGPAQSRS